MMLSKNGTYLGDGLWASTDGYMIALTADKGQPLERTVYLEPEVYRELVAYANGLGMDRFS